MPLLGYGMMHPSEEAELLIWQLDTSTALCRVFCWIAIWLLHTQIHPLLREHHYSYTMHFFASRIFYILLQNLTLVKRLSLLTTTCRALHCQHIFSDWLSGCTSISKIKQKV